MSNDALPPNQHLVRGQKWPVVGERAPSEIAPVDWSIELSGLVRQSPQWNLDELQSFPQQRRSIDIHCVTRWSILAVNFEGVRLYDLITDPAGDPIWKSESRFMRFLAWSGRNHSTSLPIDQCLELDPLVALRADGAPLDSHHGGPVRMVVPGKYFYKSIKWLRRIEFLSEDQLGFWELEAGYHNNADPWQEQRYIASTISKQDAALLISSRDFSNRDLLGLRLEGRDLRGLNARLARLRNADFSGCCLQGADFGEANLSNAQFHHADLRGAKLSGADVEGADFIGADLREADFSAASLFGATFCDSGNALNAKQAVINNTTRFDAAGLDALNEDQRTFILTNV